MREEPEEQDFETPLRELESEDPQLGERLEQQERDTESVRSDFESAKTDSAVPGAQEPDALKHKYGAEEDEPEAAEKHGSDEDEQEHAADSDDGGSDDEDSDDGSTESRGEGTPEVEDDGDES